MTLLDHLTWHELDEECWIYAADRDAGGRTTWARVRYDPFTNRWHWQVSCAVSTGFRGKEEAMDHAVAYIRTHPDLQPLSHQPRRPADVD